MDDLSPYLSQEDRAKFRDEILSARNEGFVYAARAGEARFEMPGNNGGANWGGAAVDARMGSWWWCRRICRVC